MNGDDERLDRLLCAPLAPIPDNGFSARVMAKTASADARQSWLETVVLATAACALLAGLSLAGLPESIERVGVGLATSLPLAIAGFALALTYACTRVLAD